MNALFPIACALAPLDARVSGREHPRARDGGPQPASTTRPAAVKQQSLRSRGKPRARVEHARKESKAQLLMSYLSLLGSIPARRVSLDDVSSATRLAMDRELSLRSRARAGRRFLRPRLSVVGLYLYYSSFAFDAVPPLLRIAAPSSRLPPPRSHARRDPLQVLEPQPRGRPLARASARARRRRLEHPREVGVGPVREPVRVRRRSELGETERRPPARRASAHGDAGARRESSRTPRGRPRRARRRRRRRRRAPGVGTPRGRRRPGLLPRALFSSPPKIIILAEIRRVGGSGSASSSSSVASSSSSSSSSSSASDEELDVVGLLLGAPPSLVLVLVLVVLLGVGFTRRASARSDRRVGPRDVDARLRSPPPLAPRRRFVVRVVVRRSRPPSRRGWRATRAPRDSSARLARQLVRGHGRLRRGDAARGSRPRGRHARRGEGRGGGRRRTPRRVRETAPSASDRGGGRRFRRFGGRLD